MAGVVNVAWGSHRSAQMGEGPGAGVEADELRGTHSSSPTNRLDRAIYNLFVPACEPSHHGLAQSLETPLKATTITYVDTGMEMCVTPEFVYKCAIIQPAFPTATHQNHP